MIAIVFIIAVYGIVLFNLVIGKVNNRLRERDLRKELKEFYG
jgi:flagellar motor component MotA